MPPPLTSLSDYDHNDSQKEKGGNHLVSFLQENGGQPALERANLVLSFLAHSFVWASDDDKVAKAKPAKELPASIAVPWTAITEALDRPTVLTYYSYNACNWKRINPEKGVELGNITRLLNFRGGQDEEWFSMVHVAIEAQGGSALQAMVDAHAAVIKLDAQGIALALERAAEALESCTNILRRMEERCDSYIYHTRVRLPMGGWNDSNLFPQGLGYQGVPGGNQEQRRRERFFGETGAQSSLIPAIDSSLGLQCGAGVKGDANAAGLVPYLMTMRQYMPPKHRELIVDLEPGGRALREACKEHGMETSAAFDMVLNRLWEFRTLHMELTHKFVRQWDKRDDAEVLGTGGTVFTPYLRAHRKATKEHCIHQRR
mmetsp:Transcript_36848/g.59070  ORF Transcript_36848/g.59070 Transcript_36848/m.59070 type:complete len:373 (-) Transcript_36848:110-1228(-)